MILDPQTMQPVGPTTVLPYPATSSITSPYPQGYQTPAAIKAAYDYSQALLKNSEQPVPGTKGGWTVGVQHLVDALVGGKQSYDANQGELASRGFDSSQRAQAPGTFASMTPGKSDDASSDKKASLPGDALASLTPEGSGLIDRAAEVTSKQESGGKYDQVTSTLNRQGKPQAALGKYGIMDFNVPTWTKEVLGTSMTPEQFLNDPKAQDAVYKAKMGGYIAKFGTEGAGRAWLGGEGGVNHPDRTDPLGTSVGDYGKKFASALGYAPTGADAAPDTGGKAAIVAALSKGAASKEAPGIPADQVAQADPLVAPFAVPPRPQYSRKQYELLMGSPWVSPEEKSTIRGEYMNQNQPVQVPYLGGTVTPNPADPRQQFFSPGIQKGEEKGPEGFSHPSYQTIVPPGYKAGAPKVLDLESEGGTPRAGGVPIGAPPAPLPPPAPIQVNPAAGARPIMPPAAPTIPTAPAQPAPAPVKLPGPGDDIQSAIPGNKLAMANTGTMLDGPPPGIVPATPTAAPAETPAAAIDKAQAAMESQGLPGLPPVQEAENSQERLQRNMDMGVQYEQRKALAKSDAEQYTKNLQSYSDIGIRANKALPALKIGNQMLNDPRYYSGVLSDPYEWAVKGISALSGQDKGLSAPIEIFNKILSGQIVTDLKTQLGGLGQIRLAEINLITNSVANKYNSPAANKAVINMMQREHEQAAAIGQIAEAYDKGYVPTPGPNGQETWAPRSGIQSSAELQKAINDYTTRHPLFSDDEIANIQKVFDISPKKANAKINADQVRAELSDAAHIAPGGITTPASASEPKSDYEEIKDLDGAKYGRKGTNWFPIK